MKQNKRKLSFPIGQTEESDVNSRFSDSVDAYTVNDLQNMEKSRQRSQFVSLLTRCVVIAVCIGVLGYSAYMIGDKILDNRRSASAYEELRVNESDYITIARSKDLQEPNAMLTVLQMLDADGVYEDYKPSQSTSEDKAAHYAAFYANFMKVAASYDNVYAWIYMTDTNGHVNYPIMKGDDNDFYLYHNYKGESSRSGSVFADCNLSDNYYSNYNMVLYGHNMKDGSMFHYVKKWCNDAKIKTLVQTTQIEIYTREGVYIYDILSYYIDDSNKFATISFSSGESYLEFLQTIAKKSNIRTNREYTSDSKICTLITCTNGSDGDSRYVVHGILNQFIPFE